MVETLLRDVISIRQNSLRSVRMEDDLLQGAVLDGYTLTIQAQDKLERMMGDLAANTRAWTLTGPYGAGKSFFGLFLSNLLDRRLSGHDQAWQMLRLVNPVLAEELERRGLRKGPFLAVAVTGAREPLQASLWRAFWATLANEIFPDELRISLAQVKQGGSRALLDWIRYFMMAIQQLPLEARGVLVVFDELGKSLEYAASHPQDSDVYLLQELAEFAARSGDSPFAFIGILHQAFEQYASLLDRSMQREWAKVQGRFQDVAFQEAPVQQMRLLAQVFADAQIEQNDEKDEVFIKAAKAGWCPEGMSKEEFICLSKQVFPLHPSVFVVLPYLFRRLAQNERSLFAYLSSQEPFGFQEFLASHRTGEFLRLPDLFDYLAANYQARIYASGRARPLAEALERLENTPYLSLVEVNLLKTIGLLNWLSENSPIQANAEMILSALFVPGVDEAALQAGLKTLQSRSLVVYRRFNATYIVWQGSDVDIEERLQAAREALGQNFSVADILQKYLPMRPLLARRHSYQTGTQRFFDVRYADGNNWPELDLKFSSAASGLIVLCLPSSLAEIERFHQWAQASEQSRRPDLLIGVATRAIRLAELTQELRCLHWVRENTPELRDDPVARREWRTRLAAIEQLIRLELEQTINLYQISALTGCVWWQGGLDVSQRTKRGLSVLLSDLCDALYPQSPRIWNEMLNRRELNTQGAAARRLLINGILFHGHEPLLGIEKFPPERSMYETFVRQAGMHGEVNGQWQIMAPQNNDLNLLPTWQAIYDFVFSGLPEPRPLVDLYARLAAPPLGVVQGIMPVLLAVFYKVYESEMTIYKEGTLLPQPGMPDWEVLLRRPDLFALAGCRVTGLRKAVVERMANGLRVSPSYVMPVVRRLIGVLRSLPEYAQKTHRLPEEAIRLRRAVEQARSPERFLFVEVPEALGVAPFEEGDFDGHRYEDFFERLNGGLEALTQATPRLLIWARDVWLQACGLPIGEDGWSYFRSQALLLMPRVTTPTLVPLLKRAAESEDGQSALESVLAFIANRPLRTWTDGDVDRFEAQAQHLGGLWKNEMGEVLTPELQARCQTVAEQAQPYLMGLDNDRRVLRAALRQILEQLR